MIRHMEIEIWRGGEVLTFHGPSPTTHGLERGVGVFVMLRYNGLVCSTPSGVSGLILHEANYSQHREAAVAKNTPSGFEEALLSYCDEAASRAREGRVELRVRRHICVSAGVYEYGGCSTRLGRPFAGQVAKPLSFRTSASNLRSHTGCDNLF